MGDGAMDAEDQALSALAEGCKACGWEPWDWNGQCRCDDRSEEVAVKPPPQRPDIVSCRGCGQTQAWSTWCPRCQSA